MSNKFRNILAGIIFIISIILILERPIKNYFLEQAKIETVNALKDTTVKELDENQNVPATYNFDDVKSINAPDVIKASRNKSKLPSIGEISIPSLNMNLPIVNGTSNESMLVSAGTLKANQQMGIGNYTLASHYSNAYNETLLFSPLKRAQIGMYVYLTNGHEIFTYQINEIKTVDPDAIDVLDDIGENIITLVTCEDLNATQRHIVRGKFITKISVEDASQETKNAFNIPFKTY